MNILLAVFIVSFAYLEGIQVPRYLKGPAVVGPVAADSIAQRAGLQSGDRIISVHRTPVTTWEDMEIALATAPKDALEIVAQRGSGQVALKLDPPAAGQVTPPGARHQVHAPRDGGFRRQPAFAGPESWPHARR